MENDRQIWRAWADFLQQWGMRDIAASLLEAVGPLSLLGAQVFYMTQPFLKNSAFGPHLDALTSVLDEPQNTRDFVEYLREVPSS